MKKLIFVVAMIALSFLLFSAEIESRKEDQIYETVGMIKFSSIGSFTDEANVKVELYRKGFARIINPDFLYLFSRTKEDIINFSIYNQNHTAFNAFLGLGIGLSIDAIIFCGILPVFIFPYFYLISVLILSISAGLCLIAAIPFFILASYFYKKTKIKFMEMIDKYNENLNKTGMEFKENKLDFNLLCFYF